MRAVSPADRGRSRAHRLVGAGHLRDDLGLARRHDSRRRHGNIAVVLSEQMSRSIQSIDIVLSDIRERLHAQRVVSEKDFTRWIAIRQA
ncbi:MAG: hypothetical protein P8Y71_25865 [Pseudolabrys sp.]